VFPGDCITRRVLKKWALIAFDAMGNFYFISRRDCEKETFPEKKKRQKKQDGFRFFL
jgi:hypothetical protein